MISVEISNENRYKYFKDILPDIKCDVNLLLDEYKDLWILTDRGNKLGLDNTMAMYFLTSEAFFRKFKSFILERETSKTYKITFYE